MKACALDSLVNPYATDNLISVCFFKFFLIFKLKKKALFELRENLILINTNYLKGNKNNSSRTNLHITMRSYLKTLSSLSQQTFQTHFLLTTT